MATEDAKNLKPIEEEETTDEKDNDFEYFRGLREKYNIHIDKQKSLTYLEYVTSLDLDSGLISLFQKKKATLGSYVHYFDIEMINGAVEKSTMKWTIRRRFIDVVKFDKELTEELEGLKVPKDQIPQLSSFCDTKTEGPQEHFLEAAETYLRTLMSTPVIREKSTVLYEFIELSLLPLSNGPRKFKEGYLRKKSGGRFKKNKIRIYCSVIFTRWQERWFLLTEEGIIYTVDSNSTKTREMLLFDQSFQLEYGRKATGSHTGISLVTPNRRLNLQADDNFEALDWIGEIQKAARASPYTKINRYFSFAPVREPTHHCQWYVDGDGYFSALYESLMLAKKEVFITDWWLTPELQLKRPVNEGDTEYRLDKVLGRIAKSGVKVYVIVYHEVKMMMYNDSEHVRNTLQAESSNVTVLQHPSEPFFSWSHHEKLVVIDQTIGFIGGLDLCFGRYDTNDHPINDPGLAEKKGETYPGQDFANPRLADFRNVREQPDVALIDKYTIPRMPFHDAMVKVIGPVIADMSRHFIQYWNHVGVDVYGKAEEAPLPKNTLASAPDDVAVKRENANIKLRSAFRKIVGMRHLAAEFGTPIQSLNSLDKKEKEQEEKPQSEAKPAEEKKEAEETGESKDKKKPVLTKKNTGIDESLKELVEKALETNKSEAETKTETTQEGENKESKGILSNIKDKGVSIAGQIKDMLPSVPFNIPLLGGTSKSGEQETGKNILEDDEDNIKYSNLIKSIRKKEKEYEDLQIKSEKQNPHKYYHMKAKLGGQEKTQIGDLYYQKNMLQLMFAPKEKVLEGTIACQMVRSASKWSLGLNSNGVDGNIENSIQNAYIEIIQKAKHFIYIENQFFMSGTAGKELKNEVGQALLYRIQKAHAKKERFRVLVFLPLLPAFEGEIIDSKAALLKVQVYWQYMTICRSEESIYTVLRKNGITPEDYIQFYSLRQHAKMQNGEPASEMIYIHSKILIADDDVMLIGSANINDRSLQGSRDSEIAMIFEDSKKVKSVMNGKEVEVGEFALSFRKRILAEHTGLSEDEVQDPMSIDFTKRLNERAESNTSIYREIFACYPDDNMKNLKDIEEFSKKRDLSKYDELSPKIEGHVVWFPLSFLCEDQLTPSMGSVEFYIPSETFV